MNLWPEIAFFTRLGSDGERPLTVTDWLDRLVPGAAAVIAIGSCAAWGGIPAAGPAGGPGKGSSPTGAMGLSSYLGEDFRSAAGIPLINVPGCAPPGEAFLETVVGALLHLLGLTPLELDAQNRPHWLYHRRVVPQPARIDHASFEAPLDAEASVGCPGAGIKAG